MKLGDFSYGMAQAIFSNHCASGHVPLQHHSQTLSSTRLYGFHQESIGINVEVVATETWIPNPMNRRLAIGFCALILPAKNLRPAARPTGVRLRLPQAFTSFSWFYHRQSLDRGSRKVHHQAFISLIIKWFDQSTTAAEM